MAGGMAPGGDGGDLVEDVETLGQLAEDAVPESLRRGRLVVEEAVVLVVDEELARGGVDDGRAGHGERAARVLEAVGRLVLDLRFRFWLMSGVKPPPWIMKLGMTRWKIVPS